MGAIKGANSCEITPKSVQCQAAGSRALWTLKEIGESDDDIGVGEGRHKAHQLLAINDLGSGPNKQKNKEKNLDELRTAHSPGKSKMWNQIERS